MDGFKPMVKMKTGGSVSKAVEEQKKCSGGSMKKYKEGGKADLAQDKELIKKAIAQHDKQEHPGEKTELKLKQGGRNKKKGGTVRKYKDGGAVDTKPAGDKDPIKKVKAAPKKAATPSKGTSKAAEVPAKETKPAGDKDAIKKVKAAPKKAAAPSVAVSDNDGDELPAFGRGGAISGGSIPPSIAAQLMQAQQDAQMHGQNPLPTGNAALPVDNPVVGGGAPMTAQPQPFNAYQNFRRNNPNARPGMSPAQINQVLQSPEFQRSNRQFTDR